MPAVNERPRRIRGVALDVDNTLLWRRKAGYEHAYTMPTQPVTDSIRRAQNQGVHVFIASGRPTWEVVHLFDGIPLHGLQVTSDGAQVVHAKEKTVLKEQAMEPEVAYRVTDMFDSLGVGTWAVDPGVNTKSYVEYYHVNDPKRPLTIFTSAMPSVVFEEAHKRLSQFSDLAYHTVYPVEHPHSGERGMMISHASATKLHGIFHVAEAHDIDHEELLGAGDGPNDYPLLTACGFKVAMGNAVPELKAIADYVAPPVHQDGVAHIINEIVLAQKI